jgi:hypothetical protein
MRFILPDFIDENIQERHKATIVVFCVWHIDNANQLLRQFLGR